MRVLTRDWQDLPLGIKGRKIGEEYEFRAERPPASFAVSSLHESDGDTRAEVAVRSEEPGNEGYLLRDRLNLLSSRSKVEFSNRLLAKSSNAPWIEIVEVIALVSLETFRAGEPFLFLDEAPLDQDVGYLLDKLLPLGDATVIYGDGMSGKSMTALLIGIGVSAGVGIPGFPYRQEGPGRVLYLDWEARASTHRRRLAALAQGLEVPEPKGMLRYRRMVRSLRDDLRVVKEDIDRFDIKAVVIDSMMPSCGGEPESAEVVSSFFNGLREMGDEVTKVVVSHITKAEARQNGPARPFGSVMTTNLARSTWELKRSSPEDGRYLEVGLFHTKVNDGMLCKPCSLRYDFAPGIIKPSVANPEDNPEFLAHTSPAVQIRAVLKMGAKSLEEIIEETGLSSGAIRTALKYEMADVVQVTKGGGRGNKTTWGLTARGIEEINF